MFRGHRFSLFCLFFPLVFVVSMIVSQFFFTIMPRAILWVLPISIIVMLISILTLSFSRLVKRLELSPAGEAGVISSLVYSLIPQGIYFARGRSAFAVYATFLLVAGIVIHISGFLHLEDEDIKPAIHDLCDFEEEREK